MPVRAWQGRRGRRGRAATLAVVMAALASLAAPGPASAGPLACTGDAATPQRLDLVAGGEPASGLFVAPVAPPTAVVVLAHGYSYTAEGWRDHARRIAEQTGALAIAMNYRGLVELGDDPADASPYPRSRGWPVRKGAEDLVAAAQEALRACPTIRSVVLFGISMGGNAGGLALAARAIRADGGPLFDHFVGVEGVYDLRAAYLELRALAPLDAGADRARADIEDETGGPLERAPSAYAERTVVDRADDIAASGLGGAIIVHGLEDALAIYPPAELLAHELRLRGVATDLYRVGMRGPDDDADTTFSGFAGVPTGLAGHASETSTNHVVIDTGFARLHALLAGAPPPCGRDVLVDGDPATTFTPDPDAETDRCPRGTPLSRPGPPCPAPRAGGLSARRRGDDVVVRGRVRRSACEGFARGALTVRATAGRRTRAVRLAEAGRFALRVRRAASARRVTVDVRDDLGRSSARVRVR